MNNKNKLSQDELRQKVDGFSMKHSENNSDKESFKIVDQPLYPSHSADLKDINSYK